MTAAPRVGIVGGGILGSVLALRLAEAGAQVTLLERAPSLGGLAWHGLHVRRGASAHRLVR